MYEGIDPHEPASTRLGADDVQGLMGWKYVLSIDLHLREGASIGVKVVLLGFTEQFKASGGHWKRGPHGTEISTICTIV